MWKNININKNQIEVETAKAVLIKMPHNSNRDGWMFWHPAKLVREGRHSAAVSIGYTDEFKFHLKRYGKNNNVLDEAEIDVEEFEEAFCCVDKNISEKKKKNPYETRKPEKIAPVEPMVQDELLDKE